MLKKLKHTKEQKALVVGKRRIKFRSSRFKRELRKLECPVNYNKIGWGNSQTKKGKGEGGGGILVAVDK